MGILGYIIGALMIVFSIANIVVVILQQGNQKGVGVISGGADTFFSKNKSRSIDAFLARWTKFFAIGFAVLVIVLNALIYFNVIG